MCWEFKSRVSDERKDKVADDRAEAMRAKRAGIGGLAPEADEHGRKAVSDRAPAKETVPAE